MKISHFIKFLFIALIFLWFLDYNKPKEIIFSGNKIKIGIIAPLGNSNNTTENSGLHGIKIAQQLMPLLNNGDGIEWVTIDDRNTPAESINAAKLLSETHNIAAIIMLSDSDSALALAKVADQYKTPILTLFASHPDVTLATNFINQFNFDDSFQANVAAAYARDELLADRVAILQEANNTHFQYLADEFTKQFKVTGGVISNQIILNSNSSNYLQVLQKIKEDEPELLYLPVSMEILFKIKNTLQQLNWAPKIIISDGIFSKIKNQNTFPLDTLEDIITIDAFSENTAFTSLGKQLLSKMSTENFTLKDIDSNTVLGMEGYLFLKHILNQCIKNKEKRNCINSKIRSTSKFEGIKGYISFNASGKVNRSLTINKIHNGSTKLIVQVY
ncbi:MAG: ABC transporter substrate-binding protein [Methyloprofundus sp.]|nr:ABC transporter substrate-binding protein [Methyloprofundus sp.]